jgi:hypothetical protein
MELRKKANELFLKWFHCSDKKVAYLLYQEYLKTLREASEIAPSVDAAWEMARQ